MNQSQNKNWWDRNWKWFVPIGCLGVSTLVVGGIAALALLIVGVMRSSDVYKGAVTKARAHPAVQQALGAPLEEGWFASGSINISGGSGQADLACPVSGPGGKGTIYLVATKSAGKWTYSTLVVEVRKTKQRINLLE